MANSLQLRIPLQPKGSKLLSLIQSSPATTIGYGGSRGGSKSYHGSRVILLLAITEPRIKVCIIRRTYDLVRENHIDPLLAQFPFMRPWYRKGDKEILLPNHSVIAFRYAENSGDVDGMIGKEYKYILLDQAEAFTEREMVTIKSICRWPGASPAKLVMTFNPGNIGHAYLQRIFFDRKYNPNENPADYVFIQAFGWDNIEWARAALYEDGIKGDCEGRQCGQCQSCVYYSWDNDRRYEYFVTRTQQGRELNALPQAMRIGWLMGRMDQFAGQYFDIFSRDRHVAVCRPEPWMDRWIGIDWGFAHPASTHWCSQIKPNLTAVYREYVTKGHSPKALAQEIVDRTPVEERRYVRGIGLSHDAFSQRDERDSTAKLMNEVFRQNGLPVAAHAGKDVVGTAARLYEMFRSNEIVIDPSCQKLIEVLPMVTRDDKEPERPVKFDGDDPYDSLRHALQVRQPASEVPKEVMVWAEANKIEDKFERWWFLRNNLPEPKPARVAPTYGSDWMKEASYVGR